jgi:hypothetical protein
MRTSSVIVRFLSLLDVVIILLGMFLLLLAQAQIRSKGSKTAGQAAGVGGAVDFTYLYAGTQGEERGRCYVLNPDGKIGRELRTDTADDFKGVLRGHGQSAAPNRVVMLVVSDKGFDSMWGGDRLAALEKLWGVKVVPIYNVDLTKLRSAP